MSIGDQPDRCTAMTNTEQYMLLIYLDEPKAAARSQPEVAAAVAMHTPYIEMLRKNQRYVASKVLAATRNGRTLRTADGKSVVTQGPFAESREQLGGFYVIDAPDLDEAIELAAQCPALQTVAVAIEIRPVARPASLADTGELLLAFGGVPVGGEWNVLADAGSATTLRLRDGKRVLTDGPFRDPITACRLAGACDIADPRPAHAIEIRPLR